MNTRIVLLVFGLAVLSAKSAFAQANPNVAYQNALLARALSPADQSFCAGKASSQDDLDACHVTRLLLSDVNSKQERGFPPLTDIKYTANRAEISRILDTMTKYGG